MGNNTAFKKIMITAEVLYKVQIPNLSPFKHSKSFNSENFRMRVIVEFIFKEVKKWATLGFKINMSSADSPVLFCIFWRFCLLTCADESTKIRSPDNSAALNLL